MVAALPSIMDEGLNVEGMSRYVVENKVCLGRILISSRGFAATKTADTRNRDSSLGLDIPAYLASALFIYRSGVRLLKGFYRIVVTSLWTLA